MNHLSIFLSFVKQMVISVMSLLASAYQTKCSKEAKEASVKNCVVWQSNCDAIAGILCGCIVNF